MFSHHASDLVNKLKSGCDNRNGKDTMQQEKGSYKYKQLTITIYN